MRTLEENIKAKLNHAELPYSDKMWSNIRSEIDIPAPASSSKAWILFLFLTCGLLSYFIIQMDQWNQPRVEIQKAVIVDVPTKILEKNASNSVSNKRNDSKTNNVTSTQRSSNHDTSFKTASVGLSSETKQEVEQVTVVSLSYSDNNITNKNSIFKAARDNKLSNNNSLFSSTKNNLSKPLASDFSGNNTANNPDLMEQLILLQNDQFLSYNPKSVPQIDSRFAVVRDKYSRVNKLGWFAFANNIVSSTNRSLSTEDANYVQYVSDRNLSEKQRLTNTHSLGIAKYISNRLFVQTGIQYQQIHEFFTVEDLPEYASTSPGNPDPVIFTSKNKFKRWSIPLSFGIDVPVTKAITFAPTIDFAYNLKNSFEGQIIDLNGNINSINSENTIFTSRSHAYGLSLNLNYAITPRIGVQFGVNGSRILGSIIETESIDQKMNFMGLNLGARYSIQ